MNKRTHDQKWLREWARFGCINESCAEEVSYPADLLRVDNNGNPVCQDCWDEDRIIDDMGRWDELPEFNPFGS